MLPTDVHREAEELTRYHSELIRHLQQGGARDANELWTRFQEIRRALDPISAQEVSWGLQRAKALLERLEALSSELAALRRLKDAFPG